MACRDEAARRAPNRTTFALGQRAPNRKPLGAESIRTHKGDTPRVWVKVAEPNVWRPRAVVAWEQNHGPVPVGRIVHHKDRDTTNDHPTNLELVSRAEHLMEHRQEFEQRRALAATAARWGARSG